MFSSFERRPIAQQLMIVTMVALITVSLLLLFLMGGTNLGLVNGA